MEAALGLFCSALPEDTRHYVTQSARDKDQAPLPPSPSAHSPREIEMSDSDESLSLSHVDPDSIDDLADCRVAPRASLSAPLDTADEGSPPGLKALSRVCSTMGMGRAGLITTERDTVIGFLGVVTRTDSVPTAAYVKDLLLLAHSLDLLISTHAGIDKIKGSDGVIIVRVGSKDKVPGDEERVWHECRQMCKFLLTAMLSISTMQGRGMSLQTIQGLKAGVACGNVTAGVLGSYELMYDVFGDTVNTAARLMGKASVWEVLVTERVARAATKARDAGNSPFSPHSHMVVVQSNPRVLFLKGKGLVPVRGVTYTPWCWRKLDMLMRATSSSEHLLGSARQSVQDGEGEGGVTRRVTVPWAEKVMTPSKYMDTVQRQGLCAGESSRSSGLYSDLTLDTLVHDPWTVIKARFGSCASQTTLCLSPFTFTSVPEAITRLVGSCSVALVDRHPSSLRPPVPAMPGSPRRASMGSMGEMVWGLKGPVSTNQASTFEYSDTKAHERERERDRDVPRPSLGTLTDALPKCMGGRVRTGEREVESPRVRGILDSPVGASDSEAVGDMYIGRTVSVRVSSHTSNLWLDSEPCSSEASTPLSPHSAMCTESDSLSDGYQAQLGEIDVSLSSTGSSSDSDAGAVGNSLGYRYTPAPAPADVTECVVPTDSLHTRTEGMVVHGGERERDGIGSREKSMSVLNTIHALDNALLVDLESLHTVFPEGSAVYQLADHYRAIWEQSAASDPGMDDPCDPPSTPSTPSCSAPSTARLTLRAMRHVNMRQRVGSLVLLVRAALQIIKLCWDKKFRANIFVAFASLRKLEAYYPWVVSLGISQLLFCGVVAYLVMNYFRYMDPSPLRDICWGMTVQHNGIRYCMTALLVVMAYRLVAYLYSFHRGIRATFRTLTRALLPGYGSVADGDLTKDLRVFRYLFPILKALPQHATLLLLGVCLYFLGDIIQAAFAANIEPEELSALLYLVWAIVYMCLIEGVVTVFSLPGYMAVHNLVFAGLVFGPSSMNLILSSRESSFVFVSCLFVLLLSILAGVKQVVSLFVGTRLATEAIASKVLVSRVASGRFFNRILTPLVAQTSGSAFSFAVMTPNDARTLVSALESHHVMVGIERAVLLPLILVQVRKQAALCDLESCDTLPIADSACNGLESGVKDTPRFIRDLYTALYQHQFHSPAPSLSNSLPCLSISDVDTEAEGEGEGKRERLSEGDDAPEEEEVLCLFQEWYPDLFSSMSTSVSASKSMSQSLSASLHDASLSMGTQDNMSTGGPRQGLTRVGTPPLPTLPTAPVPRLPLPPSMEARARSATRSVTRSMTRSMTPTQSQASVREELPPIPVSCTAARPTEGVESDVPCLYASQGEQDLMAEADIEFFPLMLYAKLDIVGYTKYCSQHGSDVVSLLNVLFTRFDGIVDHYTAEGVCKVKTIGDAYELMRPFTPSELQYSCPTSIRRAVCAMARAAYELVQCSVGVFESLGVPLSIRCGVGMGPAFAAVLGQYRVSYDIFGPAPIIARQMEGLSPINHVTVSRVMHDMLEVEGGFKFGGHVTPDQNIQVYEQKVMQQSQVILDTYTWQNLGQGQGRGVSPPREASTATPYDLGVSAMLSVHDSDGAGGVPRAISTTASSVSMGEDMPSIPDGTATCTGETTGEGVCNTPTPTTPSASASASAAGCGFHFHYVEGSAMAQGEGVSILGVTGGMVERERERAPLETV
ncbi:hypothetical protein KIPB_006505 [Kipferlia bialata]|uniref:adenylate cyclase n=1 Tax=Kipferlia bialata TaxID=797122 RepID=A0A9K3CYW7_9EUKA|nr:hypothetical protein KIPB_006505 [Kipferlia bialata]|eukprot:g6505.t1